MARLTNRSTSSGIDSARVSSSPDARDRIDSETPVSPAESLSSDKENYKREASVRSKKQKSSGTGMSSPSDVTSGTRHKRRRTNESSRTQPSQAAHRQELAKRVNKEYYDPDQNPDERRAVKKGLRNLFSKLNDSRAEYLQPNSKGLVETLDEADKLYKNVKQTPDATIDSRLLVATADLSYKKSKNLTLGDSSVGVDVDDFIGKCIAFMKKGEDAPAAGQRDGFPAAANTEVRAARRRQQIDEDDDVENGDSMNWEYLGRNACFLHNSRPCLSGFLLGPLSVQKKVRQQTQRKAREARASALQAVRPVEIDDEDAEKQESASLTVICGEIAKILSRVQTNGVKTLEEEFQETYGEEDEEPDPDIIKAMMRRHGIADNGCVPFFDFCVNPKSFGQTVENMFYVSFLIKEGKIGLEFDGNDLPTLGVAEAKSVAERQETQRNQAVFTLDFDTWEDLVQSYGIQKSIIPHRRDEVYDDGTVDMQAMTVPAIEEDSDVST